MTAEIHYDDPHWCEAEYNPRLRVLDFATFAPKWEQWATDARARLLPQANIAYGVHPREVMDLFRAKSPRGSVLFIHGGYWRSFSKDIFSWVADAFLKKDLSVIVVNYPLCPEVTIADIVSSVQKAVCALVQSHLTAAELSQFVVAGHSAGGYLAAALAATDWQAHGLTGHPFKGAVPVSGVFDVRALLNTSINEQLKLTQALADHLNLLARRPRDLCPIAPFFGAEESSEFCRHSLDLSRLWPKTKPALGITGRHHFDVIEDLIDPHSPIHQAVLQFAGQ